MILYDGNYGLGAHCIWHGLGAYGMDWVHMAWTGCIWHGLGA